jgi:hypothetical protein
MGAFAGSWQRIRGVACCAVRWQVGKKDPRECGSFRVTAGESWLQTGAAPRVGGESAASAAPGEVSYGDADSSVRQDHRKSAAGVARYRTPAVIVALLGRSWRGC